MTSPIKLVVGLGNPAPKYRNTRHNFGYAVLDALKQDPDARLTAYEVETFKPEGFMNESGASVKEKVNKMRCAPQEVLVVCDDFSIPLGSIRIRLGGSSGGHNGLDSIIEAFVGQDIPRLRLGIGPVPPNVDPADFVLEPFTKDEETTYKPAQVVRAVEAIKLIISVGFDAAMNRFNGAAA